MAILSDGHPKENDVIFDAKPRFGMSRDHVLVFPTPSLRRAAPVMEGYAARSLRNISSWQSYLSADCVATMIAMGWDRTT
jgi:hypothetical protein